MVSYGILNSDYAGYESGRIEVRVKGEIYSIGEISYLTNKVEEWEKFREKWNGKKVTKKQLEYIVTKVKKDFKQNKMKRC